MTTTNGVADRRAATRDLVVVRSCQQPVLLDENPADPSVNRSGPPSGTLCRASYRVASSDDGAPLMVLRFSVFDQPYEINSSTEGKFIERVAPGAFSKTIMERAGQVKVMFNHGVDGPTKDMILGKVVTLEERADGAYAEVELFDTSYNKDLLPGLRAGVYGSSFMFHVVDDKWDETPKRSATNPKGLPERTVNAVRLLEFGPVTWPANPATSAGLRSHTDEFIDRVRSANPDRYAELAERYARFRDVYGITQLRNDAPVDQEADEQPQDEPDETTDAGTGVESAGSADEQPVTQPAQAAEEIDDAPVSSHATDEDGRASTNSAATRRARLLLAGIIREDH